MIAFDVHIVPIGKGRPRVTVRSGRAWAYTPPKTTIAEKHVAAAARTNGAKPVSGPLRMHVEAIFPIPPSWPKDKRQSPPAHTSRPDCDNLLKLVADALNGVCYYDDSQLVESMVRKAYGHIPKIRVQIEAA